MCIGTKIRKKLLGGSQQHSHTYTGQNAYRKNFPMNNLLFGHINGPNNKKYFSKQKFDVYTYTNNGNSLSDIT